MKEQLRQALAIIERRGNCDYSIKSFGYTNYCKKCLFKGTEEGTEDSRNCMPNAAFKKAESYISKLSLEELLEL